MKQTVLMATQEEDDSIPAIPVLTIGHQTSADSIYMRKLNESYRAEEAAEVEREKEAWIKKVNSTRSAISQKEIDRQASIHVDPVDPNDPVLPIDPNDPVLPVDPDDPLPPIDPGDPVLPIDPEPTDTLLQHLNPVGEIPMTSNVAPSGAFTMTVPIDCYSGIGDAQPHISLVYNSQQGNGIIGMGWGLSGISKINVSYKNIYYDGSAGMPSSGLYGTASDVYTLDGSRLIRSGSNYVTVSGNVKVAPVPQTRMVGSPDFCSYSPDGSVYMYAQTGIKEYSIISSRDKNGNEVTYTYTNDSSVKLLSKITYAGGKASIEFVYSTTRSDPMTRYFNGYKYSETKRLESIKCKLNGAVIRNYILSYSTAWGASVLYSLSCKSSDRSAKPLYFNYGTGNYSSGFTKAAAQGMEWYNFDNPDFIATQRGKIGWGYGTEDDGLVHYPAKVPFVGGRSQHGLGHTKYFYYDQYDGDESIFIYSGLNVNGGTSGTPHFTDPMPSLKTEEGFVTLLFADVDRLPGEELVKVNSVVENDHDVLYFSVYASSGTTGLVRLYKRRFDMGVADIYHRSYRRSVWPRDFFPADMDGDGRWEILAVSLHQPLGYSDKKSRCWVFDLEKNTIRINQQAFVYDMATAGHKSLGNPDHLEVLDLNKDGKSDIMLINDSGLHVYEFSGNYLSNTKNTSLFTKSDMEQGDVYESLIWGDFNGDGMPDFIKPLKNCQGLYFGKGDGTFEKSSISVPNIGNSDKKIIAQDLDGDGYTDLLEYQYDSKADKTTATVYLWNHYSGFSIYSSFSMPSHGVIIPTDINSNDYYNRIAYLKNGVITIHSLRRNDALERLLSKVTNSMGTSQKVEYGQLMESSGIYTPSYVSKDKFPYTTFQGNVFVTKRLQTNSNNRIESNNRYSYTDAVIHKQGLGFCGFTNIYVNDSISNHWKKNQYDPFNYGVPVLDETQSSLSSSEYDVLVDSNKKLHILLKKRTDTDKLTGVTTTTTLTYDSKDYPVTENTDYGSGITRAVATTYQHTDADSRYALGLPLTVNVTTRRGGSSWIQKSSMTYDTKFNVTEKKVTIGDLPRSTESYTYDSQGNILTKSTQEYTSGNLLTEKYEYDAYGRRTKETDVAGISTSYVYDSETGLLKKMSDYKGRVTAFLRDAWGRAVRITLPDGSIKIRKYEWASSSSLPALVYKVTETGNNEPTTTTFYDGMGREIHKGVVRFNGNILNVNQEYDKQGRLYRTSLPYLSNPVQWTVYAYDTYDRPTAITTPGGKVTAYAYKNNTVTETKDGAACTKTFDGTGSLISVSDPAGTTTYQLRPDGQPSSITAPGGIVTSLVYDAYGRRTEIHDPSAGVRKTVYDANGDITQETDANNKTITSVYDKLHRLTSRTNAEDVRTAYTYDATGNLLTEISENGVSKSLTYDAMDRLSVLKETIVDKQWLEREYSYSPTGRLQSVAYSTASGSIGSQIYTYANGFHTRTNWSVGGIPLYTLISETERGETAAIQTGTVTRGYTFDAYGIPTGRSASSVSGTKILNLAYSFNPNTGNLLWRKDNLRDKTESFTYDNLNRLTRYGSQTVEYDFKGNILKKSDAGTLIYQQASKPYAVTGLAPVTNSVPVRAQTVTYTSYMRPSTIVENGYTCAFTYDASGNRVKTYLTHNGTPMQTRYYIGDIYEKEVSGSSATERLYLEGNYYSAPIVGVKTGSGSWQLYNILRDYQGSVMKITDVSGNTTVAEYSYDAWGRMRDPSTLSVYAVGSEPPLFLGRGYTGHEHISMFGLINMNARLYDPVLGRFLAPDPYVQLTDFSQNFNRYGYCLNNPLRYEDETGELFGIDDLIGAVIGGVINLGVNIAQGHVHNFGQGLAAFGSGAAAGAMATWGPVGWAAGGALVSGTNAWLGGARSFKDIASSVGIGALSGLVGGYAGQIANKELGGLVINGFDVASPVVKGMVGGAIGGAAGGYFGNFAATLALGGSLSEAAQSGLNGVAMGAAIGTTVGGIYGYHYANQRHINPWSGKPNIPKIAEETTTVSSNTIEDAVAYAMKNKVTHIFGKAAHNLDPLVTEFGSQESVFRAVLNAANGKLPASGIFNNVSVHVGGYDVII